MVQSDSPERTVYVPLDETVVSPQHERVVSVLGNRAPLVGTTIRVPVRSDLAFTPGLAAVIVAGGDPVDPGDAADGLPSGHHVLHEGDPILRRQRARRGRVTVSPLPSRQADDRR